MNPQPSCDTPGQWLESVFSGCDRVRYTLDGDGLFVAGRVPDLRKAIEASGLKSGERFLDLGSGDGRVVFLAAEMGALATGIEADDALYRRAKEIWDSSPPAKAGRVGASVTFIPGDFLDYSFADPDVIFYYGGGSVGRQHKLYAKLEREMHPGARLIVFRTSRLLTLNLRPHPNSLPPEYCIYYK